MKNIQFIKEYLFNRNQLDSSTTYFVAIDGSACKCLKSFFNQMGKAFRFPNYYSGNMNSFMEIMNDLSWLNSKNYVLVITHSDEFLKDENFADRESIKQILANISKEWYNVPNFPGENEFRNKAMFIVHYC